MVKREFIRTITPEKYKKHCIKKENFNEDKIDFVFYA